MFTDIIGMLKTAHEGGIQTLLIAVLCCAWLRERQQVHLLARQIYEIAATGVVRADHLSCCARQNPAKGMGPASAKRVLSYALSKLRRR